MTKRLPLLEFAASLSPEINLENVLLVACQHLLEGNALLLSSLLEHGLKPSNMYVLGKVYSTNSEICQELVSKGIYVHTASSQFYSHIAFDEHHTKAVKALWNHIKQSTSVTSFQKVIILDEGGKLIQEAHNQLEDFKNIVAVEWTSAGFNALREKKLAFPVINMARAKAKLHLESPFIAEAAVSESLRYFQETNLNPRRILVIGGGFIGTNIATQLATKYEVQRFDVISEKSDLTHSEVHTSLHEFDVIIGATGTTVLDTEDYTLLKKDIVLISSSSSDREFNAVHLRRKVPQTSNPHDNLVVDGIHLVNCGFPITFDGSRQLVPLEKIQLTLALAYTSVVQALSTSFTPGFQELNIETQQQLINKFVELGIAS